MWRGCCRSVGCRSTRSVRSAAARRRARARREGARERAARAASSRPGRAARSRAVGVGAAVDPQQAGPPAKLRLGSRAQRRRVGVGRGDEAVGLDTGELQHPPAGMHGAPRLRAVEADELAGALARRPRDQWRGEARGARGAVLKAVLRDGVAGAAALAQPADHLRRALAYGCRSRAGITSSVTRSTPWSSSQSRISAQRSNVAGSMPCSATAIVAAARRRLRSAARHGRWQRLMPPSSTCAGARGARGGSRRPGAGGLAPRCARGRVQARRSRAARATAARRRARASRRPARRVGRAQQPADAVLDQRQRASLGDGDHGQAARLRLQDHLTERVGRAGEQEHVGAGVRAGAAHRPRASRGTSRRRRDAHASAPPPVRRRRAADAGAAPARGPSRNASASRSMPFSRVMRPL